MNTDEIPLPNIRKIFQERFGYFEIELPEQDVINRTPGTLLKRSWMIKYQFGKDGEREWCEYYANTRFVSGDEHIKIYEDGEKVELPALSPMFAYKSENKEEARIKHQKEYEKTFKELSGEGGILSNGLYSGSFIINTACCLDDDKKDEKKEEINSDK